MQTPTDLINLTRLKLDAPSVSNIDAPTTDKDRRLKLSYEHYRDLELTRRRWAFAVKRADLARISGDLEGQALPYRFSPPADCLRPLRDRIDGYPTRWELRGRELVSDSAALTINYVRRVELVPEMDPFFIEALACRLAFELCESITGSQAKRADMQADYRDAMASAALNNALLNEPPSLDGNDDQYSHLTARY